jgi:hypothetical protein
MTEICTDGMKAVLDRLQRDIDCGLLLHGSKWRLETLEPRQARDVDQANDVGSQRAVYAARNLTIPIVMALIAVRDASVGSWFHEYHDDGNCIVVRGTNFTFTTGFVYVLEPDSFIEIKDDRGRRDIVSYQPVVPLACVRVTAEILNYMNVRVLDRDSQI